MTVAGDLLREAAELVDGSRNEVHGNKERSFAAIAEVWNWYLRHRKKGREQPIEPVDVANMMELLKMSRELVGTPVKDHYLDRAGYAAIAGELSHCVEAVPVREEHVDWASSHGTNYGFVAKDERLVPCAYEYSLRESA